MRIPEKSRLFTIKEFSDICGVSRSSILRLEESGYLRPHRIDPDSGYRYYDSVNVTEVTQYKALQTLGLSRFEIADLFAQKCDVKEFIREQKQRISRMHRVLEEFELRYVKKQNYYFSFIDLPEVCCYSLKSKPNSIDSSESFYYTLIEECILSGFHVSPEPLFGTRADDFKNGVAVSNEPPEITGYIPIEPSKTDNPNVVHVPAVRAFSLLAYGNYTIIDDICKKFWSEVKKRNIRPIGPARFMGLVAPFAGRDISPEDFCYRLVVPVE